MARDKKINIYITEKGAEKTRREMSKMDQVTDRLHATLKNVGIAFAAMFSVQAGFNLLASIKNTTAEFEALQIRLNSLYGSVEAGKRAFKAFSDVAATTPFALKDVVEAGAQLKAFGVDAEDNIKILSDLAAFMSVGITDAASAMGRAFAGGAGAADIFRERGVLNLIRMKSGIQDFKGDIELFRKAMFETFADPDSGIAGATDKLSDSIIGMESNAGDALDRLANVIGEKFAPVYKDALKTSINLTESFIDLLTDWEAKMEDVTNRMIISFSKLKDAAEMEQIVRLLQEMQRILLQTGDIKQVQFLAEQFDFLTRAERFALNAADDMWNGATALSMVINRLRDSTEEATEKLSDFRMGFDAINLATGEIVKGAPIVIDFFDEMAESLEDIGPDPFERWITRTRELETTIDPLNRMVKEIKEFRGEIKKASRDPGWQMMTNKANQLSTTLSHAIVQQWREGDSALQNFKNAFTATLEAMVAEILARAAILGLVSIFTGGLGGGLGILGSQSVAGWIFGGGRQQGGDVEPGKAYLVGERGPELFLPGESGRVEPTVTTNITINTSDPIAMEQWLRENKGSEMLQRILQEA